MRLSTRYLLVLCAVSSLWGGCDAADEHPGGDHISPPKDGPKMVVLSTSDGGVSWQRQPDKMIDGEAREISFCGPSSYFVLEHDVQRDKLLASTDNGSTWSEANNAYSVWKYGISSSDQNSVITTESGFLYTTNGGSDWKTTPYSPDHYYKVNMSGYPVGYAVESHSVAKTLDGGRTWHKLPPLPTLPSSTIQLIDIDYSFVNSTVLLAARAGLILRTHNDGATWDLLQVDPRNFDFNIINIEENGQTVNAFSATGKVYHSDNLGDDWAEISNPVMEPYGTSDVASNSRGLFIVGPKGACSFSSDHGVTWSKVTLPSVPDLVGIDFADDLHGVIVGKY